MLRVSSYRGVVGDGSVGDGFSITLVPRFPAQSDHLSEHVYCSCTCCISCMMTTMTWLVSSNPPRNPKAFRGNKRPSIPVKPPESSISVRHQLGG